jgi:hypothetical protein
VRGKSSLDPFIVAIRDGVVIVQEMHEVRLYPQAHRLIEPEISHLSRPTARRLRVLDIDYGGVDAGHDLFGRAIGTVIDDDDALACARLRQRAFQRL